MTGGENVHADRYTNTVYTHPGHPGDDINVDTGALSGATVVSDIDFNITTDTQGHVTDANGVVVTRNLTAANIGAAPTTHNHSAAQITSGTLAVGRGGTGVTGSTGSGNTVRSASPTFTGTVNMSTLEMADSIIRRPALDDYSILNTSVGVSANAVTITYSTAQSYEVDLLAATGNVTITISGGPPSSRYGEMIVKVKQDTVARTITWAGGIFEWPGGSAPVLTATASAFDIFHFSTWNSGTNWWGTVVQDMK